MSTPPQQPPPQPPPEEAPETVRITSYPKIIFLWPTWVLSFVLWLISMFNYSLIIDNASIEWLWIGIFALNIFIIAFEFGSSKFLLLIALLLGVIVMLILLPIYLPPLNLSQEFYLVYAVIFTVVYGFLWLSRRFNYLEVTAQQISYHQGVMADERRYPAPDCHFEKKTEDMFERIFPPFCAKLIMKHKGEPVEVLDCVPNINGRLDKIKDILEELRVKITR